MAKIRKRDKLSHYLPFRRNTCSAATSSTVPSVVVGDVASMHPSQFLTTPTSAEAHPGNTSVDIAIFRLDSLNQFGPTTANDTVQTDTTKSDRGKEKRAVCIQTTVRDTERPSLWIKAFNQLSSTESTILAPFHPSSDSKDVMTTLEEIREEMEKAVACNRDRAWTIKWRGDDIVLRDVAMKIVQWVDKFKQIGDIAVQYDPGHAALPWAVFRFLLQVNSLTHFATDYKSFFLTFSRSA